MSDFLSRLVQRTRGEAAMLRPLSHPVTAPDPGGAAWDEQIAVREAPLLARPPHAARLSPRRAEAHPQPLQELEASAPSEARARPAETVVAQPLERELADASDIGHPATTPQPTVTAMSTRSRATEAQPVRQIGAVSLRARDVGTDAVETHAVAEPPGHDTELARHDARIDIASVTTTPVPSTPTRPNALALAPELRAAQKSGSPSFASPRSTSTPSRGAAIAPASMPPELQVLAARPNDPPIVGRALAADGRIRGASASRSPMREADALHEHSTTVEVSIGRIEVRLPPRPHTAAEDPPSVASRRAAVGLAAYLDKRDTGKSR